MTRLSQILTPLALPVKFMGEFVHKIMLEVVRNKLSDGFRFEDRIEYHYDMDLLQFAGWLFEVAEYVIAMSHHYKNHCSNAT